MRSLAARPALLVAPAVLVFLGLFVAPFLYFFAISFWRVRLYRLDPDLTFVNYATALTTHLALLGQTILLALAVALVTTALGFLYAYLIRFKAGRFGDLLLFVALVTLFGGYLMKIYAWKTILGNGGVINSALLALGIIDKPWEALFYTPAAVIVTLAHFLLPFAVLPIYSSLRGLKDAEVEAARDLGATGWRLLLDILVPRAANGITTAFALSFLIAVGDYVTPLLVGGTLVMEGNIIAPQFGNFFNWPLGAAMSFVTLAAAAAVIAVFARLLAQVRPR